MPCLRHGELRAPSARSACEAVLRGFLWISCVFCLISVKVFLLIDGRIPSLRCGIDAPPAFGGLRLPFFVGHSMDYITFSYKIFWTLCSFDLVLPWTLLGHFLDTTREYHIVIYII